MPQANQSDLDSESLLISNLATVICAGTLEILWHLVILFPFCWLINKDSLKLHVIQVNEKFSWALNTGILASRPAGACPTLLMLILKNKNELN